MFSNHATLNTVINQIEWIERIIGDLIISVKDNLSKITAHGEETFGTFENRFAKGSENFNSIADKAYEKCESLPSAIALIIFLSFAGIVVIISLLFLFTKIIHRFVYHRYIKVQRSEMDQQKINAV